RTRRRLPPSRPVPQPPPAAPDRPGTSSKPVPRAGPPATSPSPTTRSAQRSFRPCPAHPHLLGPTHRRVAGCPRGESCRRAGRSGRQAPPSPYGTAFSEGSGSLSVLLGSSPITSPHLLRKRTRSQGPLLRRHYPASTLLRPCPTPAMTVACRDVEAATLARDGSPPIPRPTFPPFRAPLPGGSTGGRCRLLPPPRGLPQMAGGSASALSLSRPAQASLTLRPAGLLSRLKRPLSRGSSPSGYPAEPLVSFQINRQLSGWNLLPLMIRAFGAHCQIRTLARLFVRAIAHQPAARDRLAPAVSCRDRNPRRERQDLFTAGEQQTVRADKQRVHPLLDDVPEGPLDPARVAGIEEHQFHAVRARGSFHVAGLGLGEYRVRRVAQVRDGPHPRHQNEQELKALRGNLGEEKVDAGEISAGMTEAVDQADSHRVGALHEDNRDRAGGLLGRERSQ